jgi:hypothetical protein
MTFIVQIIGPIGVKFAIQRAGEIGKARSRDGWASDPQKTTQRRKTQPGNR